MISIDELLIPTTGDQQLEKMLSSLEATGLKARSWRAGGALRTILRVVADVYAAFTVSMLGFVRAGFLETATGGWLTLLAFYVYGVTRNEATFASGQLRLTNLGGGVFTLNPGEFRASSSITKKTFTNIASFTLSAGATLVIDVQAVEAGSASSATVGTVTVTETILPGVVCTNLSAIAGSDAELDPVLAQRCLDKLGTLSARGPRNAYAYAVRSAKRPDGSTVDINRLSVSSSSSTGTVTVYVASPSGAPSTLDVSYVAESIEAYARPETVTLNLLPATPVTLTASIVVWCRRVPGLSAQDIALLVNKALLDMVTAYPIGGIPKPPATQGYLYDSTIEGTVKGSHPAIYAVDGIASDYAINPGQVATLATTIDVRIVGGTT